MTQCIYCNDKLSPDEMCICNTNLIDARNLFRGKRHFEIEGDADEIARIIAEHRPQLEAAVYRVPESFDGPEAA